MAIAIAALVALVLAGAGVNRLVFDDGRKPVRELHRAVIADRCIGRSAESSSARCVQRSGAAARM